MFADLADPYVLNIPVPDQGGIRLNPFGNRGVFRPALESHVPCLWSMDARTNQGEELARSSCPGPNRPNSQRPDDLPEAASAGPDAQTIKWRILNC